MNRQVKCKRCGVEHHIVEDHYCLDGIVRAPRTLYPVENEPKYDPYSLAVDEAIKRGK